MGYFCMKSPHGQRKVAPVEHCGCVSCHAANKIAELEAQLKGVEEVAIHTIEERILLEAQVAALTGLRDERFPFDRDTVIAQLEAQVAALTEAAMAEIEALSYVDHKGVRHITHPTTRALAALIQESECG